MRIKIPFRIDLRLIGIVVSIAATILSVGILLKEFINISPAFYDAITAAATATAAAVIGSMLSYLLSNLIEKKRIARVFISYSTKDQDFVRRLSQDLAQNGFEILRYDQTVLIGDNIAQKLDESIAKSDFFVQVLSKDAEQSPWLRRELEQAEVNKKRIFPLLREETQIPPEIRGLKYADFTKDYSTAVPMLIKALKANTRRLEKERT